MPFIGNKPADSFTSFAKQDFTTSATTSYILDYPVANANEIALFINFVRQEPTTAYSATGTSLTLTSATSASDDMYAVFIGKALQTVNPPAGSVGTSQLASGAVTAAKLDSGIALGKIGQVVSATKTDNFSTTSGTPVDITGLSVNITPSSTSSKILIIASGNFSTQSRYGRAHVYLTGTTSQSVGDAGTGIESTNCVSPRAVDDGYTQDSFSINFLDSPASTSQQTYKLQLSQQAATTAYINRPHTIDSNGGNTISTITAIEVGA